MQINEERLYSQLGEQIKKQREGKGLTQSTLADLIGVERTSITNIEKGRQRAPLHMVYKFCAVLKIQIEELLPSQAMVLDAGFQDIELSLPPNTPKTAEFIRSLTSDS